MSYIICPNNFGIRPLGRPNPDGRHSQGTWPNNPASGRGRHSQRPRNGSPAQPECARQGRTQGPRDG